MTVSFNKFGEYFPGTGDVKDRGSGKGKYYSVNFPLRDGIDDESYQSIFEPVMQKVMDWYRPGAVVLQCGADSLSGDRLGCFNLSLKGHGRCVEFMKRFNVPLLVLGGGGYTIRNVARCWTNETAILLDEEVPDEMPFNDYIEYFGPDFRLNITPSNMQNLNDDKYLEKMKIKLIENLRHIQGAPGIALGEVPPDTYLSSDNESDDEPDLRISQYQRDMKIQHAAELSDSDDEDHRKNITAFDDEMRMPIRREFGI